MASVLKVDEIQSTSAGGITMPKQPRFDAGGTGTGEGYQQTTPIPFATVNVDNASGWNASNNKYAAPIAGDYMVTCDVGIIRTTTANGYGFIEIVQNGTNKGYSYFQSSQAETEYHHLSIQRVLTCAVGDLIHINWGGDGHYYQGPRELRLTIQYMG